MKPCPRGPGDKGDQLTELKGFKSQRLSSFFYSVVGVFLYLSFSGTAIANDCGPGFSRVGALARFDQAASGLFGVAEKAHKTLSSYLMDIVQTRGVNLFMRVGDTNSPARVHGYFFRPLSSLPPSNRFVAAWRGLNADSLGQGYKLLAQGRQLREPHVFTPLAGVLENVRDLNRAFVGQFFSGFHTPQGLELYSSFTLGMAAMGFYVVSGTSDPLTQAADKAQSNKEAWREARDRQLAIDNQWRLYKWDYRFLELRGHINKIKKFSKIVEDPKKLEILLEIQNFVSTQNFEDSDKDEKILDLDLLNNHRSTVFGELSDGEILELVEMKNVTSLRVPNDQEILQLVKFQEGINEQRIDLLGLLTLDTMPEDPAEMFKVIFSPKFYNGDFSQTVFEADDSETGKIPEPLKKLYGSLMAKEFSDMALLWGQQEKLTEGIEDLIPKQGNTYLRPKDEQFLSAFRIKVRKHDYLNLVPALTTPNGMADLEKLIRQRVGSDPKIPDELKSKQIELELKSHKELVEEIINDESDKFVKEEILGRLNSGKLTSEKAQFLLGFYLDKKMDLRAWHALGFFRRNKFKPTEHLTLEDFREAVRQQF